VSRKRQLGLEIGLNISKKNSRDRSQNSEDLSHEEMKKKLQILNTLVKWKNSLNRTSQIPNRSSWPGEKMEIAALPLIACALEDHVIILRKCPWGAMTVMDYANASIGKREERFVSRKILPVKRQDFF